jgi:hypothetical protein
LVARADERNDRERRAAGRSHHLTKEFPCPDCFAGSPAPPWWPAPPQDDSPPQAAPAPDFIQQLKDLADLKAQGILTEEEFAAQKAWILSG